MEGQVRKFVGTDLETKAKDIAFDAVVGVLDTAGKALLYEYVLPFLRGRAAPERPTDEWRDAIAAHFNKLELEEGEGT